VRLDPFRIQLLTVSLDSQLVLTLVGLVVAGLVVRQAARQEGLGLGAGHWWDLLVTAVIGGRVAWVITHADYYLRQPLQILGLLDGGLHPVGLAVGAVVWLRRFGRAGEAGSWRPVADLAAVGVLTASLFDRVGCALTTCGTGPASGLPWAVLRGDTWHAPLALAQVIILAAGLMVAAETLRVRGAACIAMLAASGLVEAVAYWAGRPSAESAVALAILAAAYTWSRWCARASAGAAGSDVGVAEADAAHPDDGARAR
jgi:hypothetical protein